MLIFKLLPVLTLVFLYGCSSLPEKPVKLDESSEQPVLPAKIADAKSSSAAQEAKTAIAPDVMFMLLSAELAGQRGQYDIALEGYLEAAKRVKDPRFAERAVMIAMYVKDAKRMEEAVAIWLRQDPANITALKLAALSSFRLDNKTAALELVERLLKTDPAGFEKALLEMASALQKENKSALVYEVLDKLAVDQPNQAVVPFVQSLLAMQLNNKSQAEAKVQQALRLQPDWDKALMLQAQLAVFSGDFNRAVLVLQNAVNKFPKDPKLKKLLAQVLIKGHQYEEAVQVYRDIISALPKDSESKFGLALIYLQMDKDNQAADILKELVNDAEWGVQAGFYMGKLAEKHDEIQEALRWYDKTTQEPFAFDAAVSAISVLSKTKQFTQAEQRLAALLSKYPTQKVRILLLQSELLSLQKQYQKAFDQLTAALRDLPDEKDLLYTRALMAERLGKLDVLEADLKKILEKNPDSPEALNALGYTLVNKPGRLDDAARYLERALQLSPNEAVILDSYGWLQFKKGDLPKALDYLQRAYAIQKENEIAAHLAELLWTLDRKKEAEKLLFERLRKSPEDEFLLEFKERVLDRAQ